MAPQNPIKVLEKIISQQERLGDFIANGPDDGFAGYVRDGYRTRCDQAANVPGWLLALSPIAKQTLSNFCQPYYDQQGVDGFEAAPPAVEGGQCPGINYQVTVIQNRADNGAPAPPFDLGIFTGPIRQVAPTVTPVVCTPPAVNNFYRFENNVGTPIYSSNSCSNFLQNPRLVCTPLSAEPPGGCGDQPSDTPVRPGPNPPPDPGPLPGPEPTDDPTGSPFPTLPLPPFPGPFGDVPVEAPPEEPVPVDPTTIPPTGGDGLPGAPDAIGNPAGSIEGGSDGEEVEFGAPPAGRVWVGCVVTATADSRLGNIPGTGPTNTVYPTVLGNVSLRYGDFFGTSKRVQSRFTLIGRETTAVVLDGCFLQAQPGVTLVVRPISAETCPESTC